MFYGFKRKSTIIFPSKSFSFSKEAVTQLFSKEQETDHVTSFQSLIVYKADKKIRLISGDIKTRVTNKNDSEMFIDNVKRGYDFLEKFNEELLSPIFLFNDYLKVKTAKFKIVILVMIFDTMVKNLSKVYKTNFQEAKNIADRGRVFIKLLNLQEREFMGFDAVEFYEELQTLRSNIVHRNKDNGKNVKYDDLNKMASASEKFVRECINLYLEKLN